MRTEVKEMFERASKIAADAVLRSEAAAREAARLEDEASAAMRAWDKAWAYVDR